jgi:4'-phosphopantetheinyl transferase
MIPTVWKSYDVITFLADIRIYHPSLYDNLDTREKEREKKFKSEYFKKRFVVSRSVLKHIIQSIRGADNPSDIILDKEQRGRIFIHRVPEIFVSLSYSGPLMAITVGKQKIGSDLEEVRKVRSKKIESCPVFHDNGDLNEKEHLTQAIQVWTLVESCAKLYDKNPYPLLNSCPLLFGANFVSYCIDRQWIFSLASGQEGITETLVWLDVSAG